MASDANSTEPAITRFLRSGRLPFLGRAEELERLAAFARTGGEASELRIAVVLAEAGMGKSRLVEEMLPRLADGGTIVLHGKLYPEGATAIPPILADAIGEHPAAVTLLRGAPERTVAGVVSALRRLARLRPTTIVLEDLHLLVEESLREFARLLEAVADEPITLLALARPQEFRARGVVERWTVETVELRSFDRASIEEMWSVLFGNAPRQEILDLVTDATRGNMLALRSTLRGVIGANALIDDGGGRWRIGVSFSDFRKVVRHAVELVVEGMVAHIDLALLERAERLAALGEVFDISAARLLLDDADTTVEALRSAGVLTLPIVVPRPVLSAAEAEEGDTAHAFSHSLLHQYLVDRRQLDPDRLLTVIARQCTLYSFLPVTLLLEQADLIRVDTETVRSAYVVLRDLAYRVDVTPDWRVAPRIADLAHALIGARSDAWSDKERQLAEVEILRLRAGIGRRQFTDDYRALIEQLLESTAEPADEEMGLHRLSALAYAIGHFQQFAPNLLEVIEKELEEFPDRFPGLRLHISYSNALHSLAYSSSHSLRMEMFARTCARLRQLAGDPELVGKEKATILFHLTSAVMWYTETEEDVIERRALLAEVRAQFHNIQNEGVESMLRMREVVFLAQTGDFGQFLELYNVVVEQFRARGLWQNIFYSRLYYQMALAALGSDLDALTRGILEAVTTAPAPLMPAGFRSIGTEWPMQIGLLRNNTGWARTTAAAMLKENEKPKELSLLACALVEGDRATVEALLTSSTELRRPDDTLHDILSALFQGSTADAERWEEEIRLQMTKVRVRMPRYLDLLVLLHSLLLTADRHPAMVERLRPLMSDALLRWMAWMEQRNQTGFMRGIFDQFESLLPPKERTALRARIVAAERGIVTPETAPDRIRISILGSIRVAPAGEELQALKGVRIRTLLGLMVADRMLKEPLSSREFLSVAASDELDYELARKKRNMGIVRLREALGADAVLTEGDTPQLNLDLVEVDLLEAHRRILSAHDALRERALARAATAVLELLDITRGEVPFPTLYEEFFEAARDEFELRVRETILRTVEALEREEDWERSEEILRQMTGLVPEDEEMTERLAAVLERSGRRMEAARVRIRSSIALES